MNQTITEAFFSKLDPNSRHHSLFDLMPDVAYFIKNKHSQFMAANKTLISKLGLSEESEIIGKSDQDFFPPYLTDQFLEMDKRILESGEIFKDHMELISNPNHSVDWHSTIKVPLYSRSGEIIGIEGVTRFIENADMSSLPYPEIYNAIDFIRRNYTEKIHIGKLAEMSGLSVSSFERQFKKHFKMTPIKYIRRMRINEACNELISTHKSMSEVALDAGFCDQSYFSTEFRRTMNITPAKYREQYKR